jgi:3-hydroxybutyryl-CoA dehydratase
MILNLGDSYNETFVVSQKIYESFIDVFNDNNPLHTSDEFAQSNKFTGKVMHGNILNGFLSYFIGECLPLKNVIIHSQEIQFKNPVYLNDSLSFNASVIGVYESVNAIEFKYQFVNNISTVVAKGKIQIGILL